MTYTSWSSDFALYLEDYLIYEHHTIILIMSRYDPMFDLKINVGQSNLFFRGPMILPYSLKTIQWLNIILWIMNQYDQTTDLKIFISRAR